MLRNAHSEGAASHRTAFGGVHRLGPFTARITSPFADLNRLIEWCYGPPEADDAATVVQFHVRVDPGPLHRRLVARQVLFKADTVAPFAPFPRNHAFPLLEWGLNWCIATRGHQYLMLHAGVLERDGNALILQIGRAHV